MNLVASPHPLGALVAGALAGFWRRYPAPAALTAEELNRQAPLVIACGLAGLACSLVRARKEPMLGRMS